MNPGGTKAHNILAILLLSFLMASVPAASWAQNDSCAAPVAMILLDKSSSMKQTIGEQTKWQLAASAIRTMTEAYNNRIKFGLMFFPEGDVRCATGQVAVPPAINMAPTINTLIDASEPFQSTPIHSILGSVETALTQPTYSGDTKYVILVTDGGESCHPDRGNAELMRSLLKERVVALQNAGIKTFVIGFGASVTPAHLNYMAYYGGTPRVNCDKEQTDASASNHCYYNATDSASLTQALQDIARVIAVEKCDGKDNNCDGQVDEGFDVGNSCEVGVGECRNSGVKICNADGSGTTCNVSPKAPVTELCDGKDNDCDGVVDNGFQLGQPCTVGVGECANTGVTICNADGSGTTCSVSPKAPGTEICDGKDNDCDGVVDNGFDLGSPCEVGVGECRNSGVKICKADGSGTQCNVSPKAPSPEVCDGKDNDCDGAVDNGFDLGAPCEVGVGECRNSGVKICKADGSGTQCNVSPKAPSPEVCDGKDNNCDGQIDETLTRSCKTACGTGTESCSNGQWGNCNAPLPTPEVCDGKDNNCDGKIDEDLSRPCSGACGDGTEQCVGGKWVDCTALKELPEGGCGCKDGETQECGSDKGMCQKGTQTCSGRYFGQCVASTEPVEETCDGKDNDCDGQVDNGDLCGDGAACFCGGCAKPCVNGECLGGGQCLGGFCVVDRCPGQQKCDFSTGSCKETPEESLPPTPQTEEDNGTQPNVEDHSHDDPPPVTEPGTNDGLLANQTANIGTKTDEQTSAHGACQIDNRSTPGNGMGLLWFLLLLAWRGRSLRKRW